MTLLPDSNLMSQESGPNGQRAVSAASAYKRMAHFIFGLTGDSKVTVSSCIRLPLLSFISDVAVHSPEGIVTYPPRENVEPRFRKMDGAGLAILRSQVNADRGRKVCACRSKGYSPRCRKNRINGNICSSSKVRSYLKNYFAY